jgi:hypothetical protein
VTVVPSPVAVIEKVSAVLDDLRVSRRAERVVTVTAQTVPMSVSVTTRQEIRLAIHGGRV